MKPIGKYIVIKPVEESLKAESGLLLSKSETDQLRYLRGLVIEVGTDVPHIKKDEEIYYDRHNAFTMMIRNEQFTIIQERDVVLVL